MSTMVKFQAASDREIVTSRLIKAPRELVWKMWTDPKHIANWWGPNGFSTTTSEFNFQNGGTWRFIMHGPDGVDYPNRVVYADISEPNHLCYKHCGEGEFDDIKFEAVVTFTDINGQTYITLRTIFATAQERDFVVEKHGAIEGAEQTLERFGNFVQKTIVESKHQLILTLPSDTEAQFTRMFDAPRELVWQAWTEPVHMQNWMTGPEGWTMEVLEHNFFVGGKWRYVWRRENSTEMEMWGIHKEIVAPETHVATENWGGPWPESVNHLVLASDAKKTIMTLTVKYSSRQDRDNAIQTGMTDGMTVSFDRLETLLSSLL